MKLKNCEEPSIDPNSSTPKIFGQTLSQIVFFMKKPFLDQKNQTENVFGKLTIDSDFLALKTSDQSLSFDF